MALEAFCNALKVMYSKNGPTPKLPSGSFQWKEFRTPTKNMLMAVCNALMQAMPEGFNLQKCIPPRLLKPRCNQSERIPLTQCEKAPLGLTSFPDDCLLHFNWNYSSQSGWLDFLEDNSFYKLCFTADEGTEVAGVRQKGLGLEVRGYAQV